ncbi:MAG: biopolymer transporter ExbD [Alphaproteobacteria bacterium]|nr:biopolymer transporter ExbD [Alphaproteobacteria bacterium]
MNLVSILIPFLLMAAQFVHLAVIDSTLPAIGPPQEAPPEEDEDPPLMLSVAVTDQGFTVMGADAVLNPDRPPDAPPPNPEEVEPTVPCKERPCAGVESYDYKELTRILSLIKDEYPDDENVIVVPESAIQYEVLVRLMDSAREDRDNRTQEGTPRSLFPYVVIAGGAN